MKRPLCIVEIEQSSIPEVSQNFIDTFQTAILLTLLEKGQLARWQLDACMEELKGIALSHGKRAGEKRLAEKGG